MTCDWICCHLFFPKQEYCQIRSHVSLTMEDEESESRKSFEEKIQLAMIRMETELRTHERERENRDRIRRQQDEQWRRRLLEAAFDGDDQEIIRVFRELSDRDTSDGLVKDDDVSLLIRSRHLNDLVNCGDANGNTPISEAAAGGHASTIKILIEKGADPNLAGYFHRTPLYRAAFGGHLEACQILLKSGGDPRIFADDGQTPLMVASLPSVEALLRSWDLTVTESILNTISITESLSENKNKKLKDVESGRLRHIYFKAYKEWNLQYKELVEARLNITKLESVQIQDNESGGPSVGQDVATALEVLRAAEVKEEFCRMRMDEIQRKFKALKLRVPDDEFSDFGAGKVISFRNLDEGLMRDSDGSIAQSNKWPLIIDPTDQSGIFLKYCDTNYLDSYVPKHMEPEVIRKSILGAIRYGKPCVLDLQGTDMFDAVVMKFDQVLPGLMDMLLSKSILQEQKYLYLVKPDDGDEYRANNFVPDRVNNFKFFILTKLTHPPDSLYLKTFPIRVTFPRIFRNGSFTERRTCPGPTCPLKSK